MTLENYKYRTDPFFLRNQFDSRSEGKYKIPIIPKAKFSEDDFKDLLLIGFDRIKVDDQSLKDRMVHFFLYDYKFEKIWKKPDESLEKLKSYKAVLTPDFSMYLEMNTAMQFYNVFRNRWCGAYLASKGIKVVPTVSWGGEETFDFCFLGIPKGSTVAVSTYMVSEHGNHKDQKEMFLKGYNEMLKRIEPERIICYNTPFPEMAGNIIYVDYELSSWKYQNSDYKPSPFVKHITGELPLPDGSDIIIKRGRVMSLIEEKGMGSAYGGEWKPKKPEDERFLGKPGEIKRTVMRNGDIYLTKIGKDGRAEIERHLTDHRQKWAHTNPHDHIIEWQDPPGSPDPQSAINYYGEVSEFKGFLKERKNGDMKRYGTESGIYNEGFESLSDFKFCMKYHGEVSFLWKERTYGITHVSDSICVYEADKQETERRFATADEALTYVLADGETLRNVITKVDVVARTI